jgi:hypothetical protein
LTIAGRAEFSLVWQRMLFGVALELSVQQASIIFDN